MSTLTMAAPIGLFYHSLTATTLTSANHLWDMGTNASTAIDHVIYMGIPMFPLPSMPLVAPQPLAPVHGPFLPPAAPAVVAPPEGFNRYVNASDLLEEYIRWLGEQRVRSAQVLGLPLELFVKWLVLRACEQEGEEPGLTLELPSPRRHSRRCAGCGRFIAAAAPVPFHGPSCSGRYFARQLQEAA